jgi:ABC-type glutathione transport system ATPase component
MPNPSAGATPLLSVENVSLGYPVYRGWLLPREVDRVPAVRDVSLSVSRGEILGLVGESGCGKSSLLKACMMVARPDRGRILYGGKDLTEMTASELDVARASMQVVFQNDYASLNPSRSVVEAVAEPLRQFSDLNTNEILPHVASALRRVGLSLHSASRLPRALSGGQRQRVSIARAVTVRPDIFFADEPVRALDVSIQAQIINLLKDLRERLGFAMVFVSHDLSVVRSLCDRVAVMYNGRIVEDRPVGEIYEDPHHDYTKRLLKAARRVSFEALSSGQGR